MCDDSQILRYGTGLLVAACVNRAPPGTFGVAVAEVGVLDQLKVHLVVEYCVHSSHNTPF